MRLRAQPAILHYKALTRSTASALRDSAPMVSPKFLPECLKRLESSRAPYADLSSIPAFIQSRVRRAHTREALKNPRQLKPIPRGPKPPQGPVMRGTAIQSWSRSSGSAQRRGSSEPPTHTQDTDWRCSQSNCNPGRDTRWLKENAGASGTTQHRPVFLKRWKAYVTWCSGDLRGQPHPACTDRRMP